MPNTPTTTLCNGVVVKVGDVVPTTDEMIAWCEDRIRFSERMRDNALAEGLSNSALAHGRQIEMCSAIAARLRQARGKAEPAPTYDAQPPGLTVLAPKREKE